MYRTADGFAMISKTRISACAAIAVGLLFSSAHAQYNAVLVHPTERPTLNPYTGDPRPDILPYYFHHQIPEYRRVYNRPRFWGGMIAHFIEPTSQEAMVWCENLHAGAYDEKHAPPRYKRYFGPKPWEVLQTGARPDFADPESIVPGPLSSADAYDSSQTPEPVPYENSFDTPEPLEGLNSSR